jgi:membrane-bound lytic murein transglycosylase D
VEADIASTKYDIPITLNEQVLKSLNFWLNRGHKYFHDGLLRSGRYREMIERIFREESIPLDVLYLAQVESLFKANAVSRARARGIWQFARGTAIRYGLKVNSAIDERSDPEKSTRAAARYLNDLYAMFHDWNLVLAAYNWGEGKVQKLMNRSGLNDFWEISGLRRRNFPRETKNHVPLIHASIILAHNPEKYGFTGEMDPPESYHLLAIPHPIDLRAAAKILNTSVDELRELNPALRTYYTPPNYPDFQLKVAPGNDPELYRKVAELPAVKFKPPAWGSPSRYRIQEGDTLSGIAARYRVSVQALQDANDISSPKALKIGSYIRIPARAPAVNASKGTSISPKRAAASRTRTGSSATRNKSRTSAKTSPSAVKSGKQRPGAPIAPSPANAPAKSRTSASVLKGSRGTDR